MVDLFVSYTCCLIIVWCHKTSVWWVKTYTCCILHNSAYKYTHAIRSHLAISKVFIVLVSLWLLQTCRGHFDRCTGVLHMCVTPCVRFFFCYVNVFMNLCLCKYVREKERERERDLQQLKLDLLTLLKMTYQITQRTGICPCPWFTSNCFIVLHFRRMRL